MKGGTGMSQKKVTLETDLKTLTSEELEAHQRRCWDRSTECDRERDRRQSLPWVWASEEATVKQIRAALSKPERVGADKPEPWAKPASVLDAYIDGDRVTHNDKTWTVTGRGAVYSEPGDTDPIQGVLWTEEQVSADTGAEDVKPE